MGRTPTPDQSVLQRVDPHLLRHAAEIGAEFLMGFKAVDRISRPAATIFGSARISETHPVYRLAREAGRLLAEEGFAVVTGGGPGVMEAANRGARDGGGVSVGFRIKLPHFEPENEYLDISVLFEHFYARKTMLVKAAEGFILFPGGFGTLDELFESLVLIQTGEVKHFPAVLVGQSYWEGNARVDPAEPAARRVDLRGGPRAALHHERPGGSRGDGRGLLPQQVRRLAGRAGQGRRAVAVDLAADHVQAGPPEVSAPDVDAEARGERAASARPVDDSRSS